MQLVNIGFGNLVSVGRLIAVVSPDSAPIKRLIQESRDRGMLIDATYGRKTAAVLVMDSDHVVLSALPAEKLGPRLGLTAEDFSVPLFGRVYAALRERWQNDLAITPAALADSLSPAEMAHLTAVLQKQEPPLSETALADYLRILREERAKARVSDASDLLAMQRDLKKKKGYGGS